jgi:hypothetical protein
VLILTAFSIGLNTLSFNVVFFFFFFFHVLYFFFIKNGIGIIEKDRDDTSVQN